MTDQQAVLDVLEQARRWEPFVGPGGTWVWRIPGSEREPYTVSPTSCTCPAQQFNPETPCKHRSALALYRRVAGAYLRHHRETALAPPAATREETPPLSDPARHPSLPEPAPGHPAPLPIQPAALPRVLVHTELDVPIFFEPTTSQFVAHVGVAVVGRGSENLLRSSSFETVVEKIRLRALVVPVEGYQIDWDTGTDDDADVLSIYPCTVLEYHPRRNEPFVIRVTERDRSRTREGPQAIVSRVRAVQAVYLPQPEHARKLRAAVIAVRDEVRRHAEADRRLWGEVTAAQAEIPTLTDSQIRSVQEHDAQVAADRASVGAVVFDLDQDEREEAAP